MTDDALRVWVDGRLVRPGEAALAGNDHGLTVGDGVFETLKVVDGEPFAVTRHLRRLAQSAAGLGLVVPDPDRFRAGMAAVLAGGAPLRFGRLRLTLTAGPGPLGSDRAPGRASYLVMAAPATMPPQSSAVRIVPWTRNERSAVAGLKTTSYADNVVALAYARARAADEAIFTNTQGELCEGTGSNIFVVRDGRLLTPPLSSGCLAGITRELVLEWALADGLDVAETDLQLSDLRTADEVLLTSTIRDVQPVHAVDDRAIPVLGAVGRAVTAAFARGTGRQLDP